MFAAPVAVSANTTYVASYTLAVAGAYAESPFSGAVTNGPLTALATNGVYANGSTPTFPRGSFGQQFWVDILFATDSGDSGAISSDSGADSTTDSGTTQDSGPDNCTASSPCSLWSTASLPAGVGYSSPVTLGLQWQADENGFIAGVTFYKEDDADTHTVTLWDSTGDVLASATDIDGSETASGWQSVSFASPVAVTAATTYVASYTMAVAGDYADSPFNSAYTNGPLTALAVNGFYAVGSSPTFPDATFGEQFWVDVLFYDQSGSSGSDGGD
jgi:hypothetical protein